MSDSTLQPFPPWMVRNGETWTIIDFSVHLAGYPDIEHINLSQYEQDRRARNTLLVIAMRDFRVVDRGGSGGWVSIACGSESVGWLNLVVEDGPELAQVLEQAVGRFRDFPTIEEIMSASPFGGSDAETFSGLFLESITIETQISPINAIAELEAVTILWEMVFERFQLGAGDGPTTLSLLMYADDGRTMTLLERGDYLLLSQEDEQVDHSDLRLASCLKRLRKMTSWASRGLDIDKRCHGAIEAHIRLKPALAGVYGSASSD